MAQKLTTYDDLDGTLIENGQGGAVTFSLDGREYRLDLTKANREKLAEALAPFIAVAQKVSETSRAASAPAKSAPKPYELRDAREWLLANGHDVSKRGPIQPQFLKVYEEAHGLGEKE